jgi:hypothetical protein
MVCGDRGSAMAQRRNKRDESAQSAASSTASAEEAATAAAAAQQAADRPPQVGRVDLGALSLDVPPGWRFYPLDDRVVGRPESKVGVLQLRVVPRHAAPASATHEMFMAIARDMSGYELQGPGTDPARERIDCCLAGGESFRSGNDYVPVWYHHRPEGIAAAWFACKASRFAERSVKQVVRQCDKIIASLRLPAPPHA